MDTLIFFSTSPILAPNQNFELQHKIPQNSKIKMPPKKQYKMINNQILKKKKSIWLLTYNLPKRFLFSYCSLYTLNELKSFIYLEKRGKIEESV